MILLFTKWGDSKADTWSGTPLGILSGLQKIHGEEKIKDVVISQKRIQKVLCKVVRGIGKIFHINECEVTEHKFDDRIVKKLLMDCHEQPNIMFTEQLSKYIDNSYLFIDCSVDFAYRCQNSGELFSQYIPLKKTGKHSLIHIRKNRADVFYKKCRGIFTMGQWLADDLVKNTKVEEKKVHCVGGGCNISIEKVDDSKKQGNKILFVGKDFERKGGFLVLDAFKILNDKYPGKYQLYIAGPKEWPGKGNIPDGIHFLGLKTTEELEKYYNLCDIFVMPSYFEAYGIVFAEALIYGLPCIGRDAFAMKEFIVEGENGYLIHEDSAEYLAKKMYDLLSDEKIRQGVIQKKEHYIEKYSWESVAKRITDVILNDGYEV